MPTYTDDDTWSVDSGYDDVDAIPLKFHRVIFLMLAPIKIAASTVSREEYEQHFIAILADKFSKQVASYCLAINTNSTQAWYTERMELIKTYPGLSTEQGWLSYKELNVILVNKLREQFGIDKLGPILKDFNAFLASSAPKADEDMPLLTAELGFQFNENDVWYPTQMLKVLINTLPSNYARLVLKGAKLHSRSTNEIIELINAAPDHVTEINISERNYPQGSKEQLVSILTALRKSKLILKLKPIDFGVGKLSESELNEVMRVMPPRTYLRIKGMPLDCCLQSKARASLHEFLPKIETERFKIQDTLLEEFLNDDIKLQHIVAGLAEFFKQLPAHIRLMHNLDLVIENNEFAFTNLVVPAYAMISDSGLQHLIATLNNDQTQLSYLCCALLLTGEINCYWDNSKRGTDAEQYARKRYKDALEFYKLAAIDIKLPPAASRHIVSCAKSDLVQRGNGDHKYESFLQYVFKTCDYLDAAPALLWRNPYRCKGYLQEAEVNNPFRYKLS